MTDQNGAASVRHDRPEDVDVSIRPATSDDVEHVKWALYLALAWNPRRELPPPELTLEHPEALRYHRDWGRPGDLGVIAERDATVLGVAYGRLFTEDDHGHGYVDARTPEIAIAVSEDERGKGLGMRLLDALAGQARQMGFAQLSLSVDTDNPALRLYERVGYRTIATDEGGSRMLLEL